MKTTESSPRFFAVTTSGLTATRWLTYVLASHSDVFVAHGHCALDSVIDGDFRKEKETAGLESLTRGNEARGFYDSHSLEEVLAAYQAIKPQARACGFVHSYTMHTLIQAARSPAALADLRIMNVVRHPVNLIASHYSLVRSAEIHPPLYRYYVDDVLPQALQQFPELFLIGCPDYRAFLAFAVSCRVVNNLILDMCYPGIRHLKMETLTTQAPALCDFCENLTGLPYAAATVEAFIRQGAINRHRPGTSSRCPRSIYASWAPWQQDMAHTMISGVVLHWLEGMGYDLSMFRDKAKPAGAAASDSVGAPCLGDCLRSLDARHPLLAYMTPEGSNRVRAIETAYQGFAVQRARGRVYGVAHSLELADVANIDEETLLDLQEDGLCLSGDSLEEVWLAIGRVLSSRPVLLEEYRGFNLVAFRAKYYGAALGTAVNLENLKANDRKKWIAEGRLVIGQTTEIVKRRIDEIVQAEEAPARAARRHNRDRFTAPAIAPHELNQRYKQQWDRAERLQDELDAIKKSRAYRLLCWWRGIARLWRKASRPAPDSGPLSAFPMENLEHCQGPGVGSVSILIPFKDRVELLRNCLRSLRRGSYPSVEILLLDNGSTCPRTLRYLERGRNLSAFQVIPCPGPFNFSRVCNVGARQASGDFLLFLNNDTEVLTPDWLEHLLRLGNRPDIGIVGATLLYPDGTLQHAGILPREGGQWSHVYRGLPQDYPGERGELLHARTVPAVTGACLMIRRTLFMEMGGFDERYDLTFNDVDLCSRIRGRGLKVAISPQARLWHFESMSRGFSRESLRAQTEAPSAGLQAG
jgi:GT2 family glycosyltransferase